MPVLKQNHAVPLGNMTAFKIMQHILPSITPVLKSLIIRSLVWVGGMNPDQDFKDFEPTLAVLILQSKLHGSCDNTCTPDT